LIKIQFILFFKY